MKPFVFVCLIAVVAVSGFAHAEPKKHKENKCGKVCQEHINGYKWAKKKGINHPVRCGDGSTTGKQFNAGCKRAASEK